MMFRVCFSVGYSSGSPGNEHTTTKRVCICRHCWKELGLDLGRWASPLPAGRCGVEHHVLMLTLQRHMLCKVMSPASLGLSPPASNHSSKDLGKKVC